MAVSSKDQSIMRAGRFTPPPCGADASARIGAVETYLMQLSEELEYLLGLLAAGQAESGGPAAAMTGGTGGGDGTDG